METKVFTIHRGKQSLSDKALDARQKLVRELQNTQHRLEEVRRLKGVTYYNDSKATSIITTKDSIRCLKKPIIWMVCTTPYERDFMLLNKIVKYKVKTIIAVGENAENVKSEMEKLVDTFYSVTDLKDGVKIAHKIGLKGDSILFSPSCPSDDKYANYVERGNAFKKMISVLK